MLACTHTFWHGRIGCSGGAACHREPGQNELHEHKVVLLETRTPQPTKKDWQSLIVQNNTVHAGIPPYSRPQSVLLVVAPGNKGKDFVWR